jgi:hypothetical protein
MSQIISDTERLDKLQRLTKGYGLGWILRDSTTGRGMRLQESSAPGAADSVRQAIDNYNEAEGTSSAVDPSNIIHQAKRFVAAEEVCHMVVEQLAAWDALDPDRKDDSPDNRAIREVVAKWKSTLPKA